MTSHSTYPRRPYSGSCHCGLVRYIVWLQFADANSDAVKKSSSFSPSSAGDNSSSSSSSGGGGGDNGRPAVDRSRALNGHEMYRCNCTTCHKLAILHLRLPNAPDDFAILAPLQLLPTPLQDNNNNSTTTTTTTTNTDTVVAGLQLEQPGAIEPGLRTYRCFGGTQDWFFCGRCGVRCFTIRGECEGGTARVPARLLRVPAAAEGGAGRVALAADEGLVKDGEDEEGVQQEEVEEEEEEVEVPVWRPKRQGWKESYPCYLSINATSLDIDQKGLDLRTWHASGWIIYHDYLTGSGKSSKVPFAGGFY